MPRRLPAPIVVLLLVISLAGCRAGLFTGGDAAPPSSPDVAIIAHRGASYEAPENTLASVRRGWQAGADAVEVDVHLSKDDRVVVIHDKTTERTGGRARAVRDQTLAELRQLDVGRFKGEEWAGERIPTLEEVMETVPEDRQLFVEIKVGQEILPPLGRVLRESGLPPEQVVLIGFGHATMAAAKQAFPEHTVLWLSGFQEQDDGTWSPGVEELIEKARQAEVDGLNVQAADVVDAAFVRRVKEAGFPLYVWTVNDPATARRLQEAGVDGITTDRPAWLRSRLIRADAVSVR